MKVKIEMTLDIDNESWTLNYGIEHQADIRADVRSYAIDMVTEHFRDMSLLLEEKENPTP